MRSVDTMDIHSKQITPIQYMITNADQHNQHKHQVTCYFDKDPTDLWNYYVQEVKLEDADNYIGAKFMQMKPEPFIVKTIYDNETNTVKKLYHIKKQGESIIIIKNNEEIYAGPITHIPKILKHELKMKLYKYFQRMF